MKVSVLSPPPQYGYQLLGSGITGIFQVVAVAARKIEDAKEFAVKHGIEKAYSDYENLAKDADIDVAMNDLELKMHIKFHFKVIYIGAINSVHLPLAKMFLNAGKAVLCEKPLCVNVKETKELVELARSKKVFLMEAVWSRCLPVYQVRQAARQSTLT